MAGRKICVDRDMTAKDAAFVDERNKGGML